MIYINILKNQESDLKLKIKEIELLFSFKNLLNEALIFLKRWYKNY